MADSLTGDARRFLRVLFDRADGQMYQSFHEAEIGAAVPLRPERTQAVLRYLLSEQFVQGTMDGEVSLTAAGINALEAAPAQGGGGGSRTVGNVTFAGPATVTLGDHSPINITNLTVGDLLRGVEAEIEGKVADPEDRKSLLAKVRDLLNSPAAGEIIKVGLPEILRRLPS